METKKQPQTAVKSRFEEAFEKFATAPDQATVQQRVKEAIEKHYNELNNRDTVKLIHSCIDLTSLSSTDHEDHIFRLVNTVNELDENDPSIPPVASICVYPNHVHTVKEHLAVEEVHITSVAGGFPSAQTFMEIKVAEIQLAVHDGADEIDVVLPIGEFLSGNYNEVVEQLLEQHDACHGAIYKVILETGALKTTENIQRASILALYSDADFIKTSTGKEYPGANLEAAYVMANVLKQYYDQEGQKRGLKISGGVRTTEDAIKYLCIVKEVLGDEWLDNRLFRFGATSLESDVLKYLQ